MNRIHFCSFMVLAILLILAGCIVVPTGSKNPYPPEILKQFSEQRADKNLVRQTLGDPQATKSAGKYWFYSTTRDVAWLILDNRGGGISLFEWVMVEFDDSGHVIFYEYNNKKDGCLSNGICLADYLAAVAAPKVQDAVAKSYEACNDECAVYVYLEPVPFLGMNAPVSIYIDGQPRGTIDHETYLFLTHPYGEISISVYDLSMTAKCEGGNRLYVRSEKKPDFSRKTGKTLSPVNAVDGEAAIRTRQLALPD